jgi:hypothetical protein
VSVSLGSPRRDKSVEVELLGETVQLERIGVDGDMEAAAEAFRQLDGRVDALGLGGADLGLMVDGRWYPLHSIRHVVRHVRQTPLVDGTGLKNTLEYRIGRLLAEQLGEYLDAQGRRALITLGADRWGMTRALVGAGFDCVFGDLMFGLGWPLPLRTTRQVKVLAALIMPFASRLPFQWLYPVGPAQEIRKPKWEAYYRWATVIAGDRHYVVRHMPEDLHGKVIVTNTTVPEDVALFRSAGVRYLVTTTPVLSGRSFGTNLIEAGVIAASGLGRVLTHPELDEMLTRLAIEPQVQELN